MRIEYINMDGRMSFLFVLDDSVECTFYDFTSQFARTLLEVKAITFTGGWGTKYS
jgi:hypothetical protein